MKKEKLQLKKWQEETRRVLELTKTRLLAKEEQLKNLKRILDTVDEMCDEIEKLNKQLADKQAEIDNLKQQLEQKRAEIESLHKELKEKFVV